MNAGRNAPCPCGSGKKYKHCCAGKETQSKRTMWVSAFVALVLLGGLLAGVVLTQSGEGEGVGADGRVWSEAHQHWHDAP